MGMSRRGESCAKDVVSFTTLLTLAVTFMVRFIRERNAR